MGADEDAYRKISKNRRVMRRQQNFAITERTVSKSAGQSSNSATFACSRQRRGAATFRRARHTNSALDNTNLSGDPFWVAPLHATGDPHPAEAWSRRPLDLLEHCVGRSAFHVDMRLSPKIAYGEFLILYVELLGAPKRLRRLLFSHKSKKQ